MPKQKKDRSHKKFRPRNPDDIKLRHQPWRLVGVFEPLLTMISYLEVHGVVLMEGEHPVFLNQNDGKLYHALPAMTAFIEMFELFEVRYSKPLPLEALRQLQSKIADPNAEITSDDTSAARAAIEVIRRELFDLTRGQADELVEDYKIRLALDGEFFD